MVKNGKKLGENVQKYGKIVKNVEKCQKNPVRNIEIQPITCKKPSKI